MTLITTILLAFVILLAAIAGMAVGVLNGRRPIRGSCGGLNSGGCDLFRGGRCQRESRQ